MIPYLEGEKGWGNGKRGLQQSLEICLALDHVLNSRHLEYRAGWEGGGWPLLWGVRDSLSRLFFVFSDP